MSDEELLARIIQCEAGGEGEDGMKAVATVIVNRLNQTKGEYGRQKTLGDVIFAPVQFDCARESIRGKYNPQNIYNMRPEQVHYDIAQWALGGNKLPIVADALWYFNPYKPSCKSNFPNNSGEFGIRIGGHCFYLPTNEYYKT